MPSPASACTSAPGPATTAPPPDPRSSGHGDAASEEKSRRKAILIRAGIHILGTHLFAGSVLLLFALGNRHWTPSPNERRADVLCPAPSGH
ncbi:DUF6126 family protein [Kitasatospora sp. NPDC127111]|uniref:DUF6126 family protein n=1 Tax=Kitasatospora sp. NPDC127111 TaxID=3345363 RepID=UPI0036357840